MPRPVDIPISLDPALGKEALDLVHATKPALDQWIDAKVDSLVDRSRKELAQAKQDVEADLARLQNDLGSDRQYLSRMLKELRSLESQVGSGDQYAEFAALRDAVAALSGKLDEREERLRGVGQKVVGAVEKLGRRLIGI